MEDREILEKELEAFKMIEENLDDKTVKFYKAIENILAENENLKQALIINKNLYEEVCNKNKELEAQNNIYKKYAVMMTTEGLIINGVKFSFEDYIPKSLIKEKIEEYNKIEKEMHENKNHSNDINEIYKYAVEEDKAKYGVIVLQELLRRGEIRCVNTV